MTSGILAIPMYPIEFINAEFTETWLNIVRNQIMVKDKTDTYQLSLLPKILLGSALLVLSLSSVGSVDSVAEIFSLESLRHLS